MVFQQFSNFEVETGHFEWQALALPPPCLFGGLASPEVVATAHVLRARAVCAMEEAEEMYYEDEGSGSEKRGRPKDGFFSGLAKSCGMENKNYGQIKLNWFHVFGSNKTENTEIGLNKNHRDKAW